MKTILKFLRNDRGSETVEWAIIIGLIAVGAIVFAAAIGQHVYDAFSNLSDAFDAAPVPGGA